MLDVFGARGIYLDQLGSATPLPCYDSSHGHLGSGDGAASAHHHGLYNHGYLRMIKRIKERSRLIDPSSFLMIENCGDIYSQFLYANLTWNGQAYDEFFNIYKYTFPEFIQVNMINPRRIDDRNLRYAWFYRDLARAFVLGSVFWMELGDRFGPGNEELLESAREALRLRQQAAPYIARGKYKDDVGLTFIGDRGAAPDSEPRAWWNGKDGPDGKGDCDWGGPAFQRPHDDHCQPLDFGERRAPCPDLQSAEGVGQKDLGRRQFWRRSGSREEASRYQLCAWRSAV